MLEILVYSAPGAFLLWLLLYGIWQVRNEEILAADLLEEEERAEKRAKERAEWRNAWIRAQNSHQQIETRLEKLSAEMATRICPYCKTTQQRLETCNSCGHRP